MISCDLISVKNYFGVSLRSEKRKSRCLAARTGHTSRYRVALRQRCSKLRCIYII